MTKKSKSGSQGCGLHSDDLDICGKKSFCHVEIYLMFDLFVCFPVQAYKP